MPGIIDVVLNEFLGYLCDKGLHCERVRDGFTAHLSVYRRHEPNPSWMDTLGWVVVEVDVIRIIPFTVASGRLSTVIQLADPNAFELAYAVLDRDIVAG